MLGDLGRGELMYRGQEGRRKLVRVGGGGGCARM